MSSGLPHNLIMLPIGAASSTPQICSAQFVMLNFNLLAEHTQITWSVSRLLLLLLLQSLPAALHISTAIPLYVCVRCIFMAYLSLELSLRVQFIFIYIYAVYIYYIVSDKAAAMRQIKFAYCLAVAWCGMEGGEGLGREGCLWLRLRLRLINMHIA